MTDQRERSRSLVRDARADREGLRTRLAKATTDKERSRLRGLLDRATRRVTSRTRDLNQLGAEVSYATVDLSIEGDRRSGAIADPDDRWTPGDALSDAGRVLEVVAGVLLIAARDPAPDRRDLIVLAVLAGRVVRAPAARAGARSPRNAAETCVRRSGVVDPLRSDGEHTRDGRAADPRSRCSRRWARRTSSWWPRSATRGASGRTRSSSARATSPTPVTWSAAAMRGRCASTPTGARSRSPPSGRATSSASWRCSTTRSARPRWRRSRSSTCSRSSAPTCGG